MSEEEEKEKARKSRSRKIKRYALIGLATVGGGALIGSFIPDFRIPWSCLAESREQYSLCWESKYIREMGRAIDYLVQTGMSVATTEALKYTVLSGSEGLIEDVILLGAPVSGDAKYWKPISKVVAGKIGKSSEGVSNLLKGESQERLSDLPKGESLPEKTDGDLNKEETTNGDTKAETSHEADIANSSEERGQSDHINDKEKEKNSETEKVPLKNEKQDGGCRSTETRHEAEGEKLAGLVSAKISVPLKKDTDKEIDSHTEISHENSVIPTQESATGSGNSVNDKTEKDKKKMKVVKESYDRNFCPEKPNPLTVSYKNSDDEGSNVEFSKGEKASRGKAKAEKEADEEDCFFTDSDPPKTPVKTNAIIASGKEDVNAKSPKEETYLHYIAHAYRDDDDEAILNPVVFQLSNAGIDVNAVDADGNTALHIAAKNPGCRKLIRLLMMIGADPLLKNADGQTANQLAKSSPENVKILKFLSPGMFHAVEKNDTEIIDRLIANWCKITGEMIQIAQNNGNEAMVKVLNLQENTVNCVHAALSGDRQKLRPFLKMGNIKIHTSTTSYIDKTTGEFLTIPLVCEAALYGLAPIVRKLMRKKAKPNTTVETKPFYLYFMENMPAEKPFYEVLKIIIDKVDFKNTSHDVHTILDTAYVKKVPIDVLQIMSANGLDIFAIDDNGHFLRDRIVIKNVCEAPLKLSTETDYVDSVVVDMANNGCIDLLQELVERGYEHVNVSVDGMGSVQMGLAKSVGDNRAHSFIEDVDRLQMGRTPLFCACALEEGQDLVAALTKLGCKMDDKDKVII
ncbi:TMCO4-like protein [Mya arenaria]|uniref:TMCO4-like protein n=1 Tax=Mya arenaria TaxID=6604 RepID=A0ABY7F165_MYAAR|nr:TMCO4-like protein [Mya arenaria]